MFSSFDRIPTCDGLTDGLTDGQTSCHSIVRAMHTRRAVKTIADICFLLANYVDWSKISDEFAR